MLITKIDTKAIDYYYAGHTLQEIATIYNVSRQGVHDYLKRRHVLMSKYHTYFNHEMCCGDKNFSNVIWVRDITRWKK